MIKAMESCRGKMFLGLEMDISLYEGTVCAWECLATSLPASSRSFIGGFL